MAEVGEEIAAEASRPSPAVNHSEAAAEQTPETPDITPSTSVRATEQALTDAGVSEESAAKHGDHTSDVPMVRFASRRREKRPLKRPRRGVGASGAESDTEDKAEISIRQDAELLREAQRLRERRRIAVLQSSNASDFHRSGAAGEGDDGADDDGLIIAGLRTQFAAERANQELEQQCEQFIAERMRARGYDLADTDVSNGRGETRNEEDELYRVPEHLRAPEQPAYDPGEGLPAAGLEEVELAPEERLKNVEKTRAALSGVMNRPRGRATDHILVDRFRKRFKH